MMEDQDKIDLVVTNDQTDDWTLAIVALEEWSPLEVKLAALHEKLNTYATFVVGGQFHEMYPLAVGKRVEIVLHYRHEPPDSVVDLLWRAAEALEGHRIELKLKAVP